MFGRVAQPFSNSGTFSVIQRETPFPSAAAPHPGSGHGGCYRLPGVSHGGAGVRPLPREGLRFPSPLRARRSAREDAGREAEVGFPVQPLSRPFRLRDRDPRVTGLPDVGKECAHLCGSSWRSGPRGGLRPVQAHGACARRACAWRDTLPSPACILTPDPGALPSFPPCTGARGSRDGHPSLQQAGPRGATSTPTSHLNTGDRDTDRESPWPLWGSQRLCGPQSRGAWPSQGACAQRQRARWGWLCGPGVQSRRCHCLVLGLLRRHKGLQSLSPSSAKRASNSPRVTTKWHGCRERPAQRTPDAGSRQSA